MKHGFRLGQHCSCELERDVASTQTLWQTLLWPAQNISIHFFFFFALIYLPPPVTDDPPAVATTQCFQCYYETHD